MAELNRSLFPEEQECAKERTTTASVAVVIVNYNTRNLLRDCLSSVGQEAPNRVIVVDNASSDGSAEMVQTEYPWAVLRSNRTNVGYGTAANQGIASCSEEYVLLLNGDTLVRSGTLQALSAYLDEHPKAAVVGPRLVNSDGTLQASCYPFPGTLTWTFDNDDIGSLLRCVPGLRNRLLRTWPHTRARVVPWIKGAALAIRRAAFQSVNGFDESFFLYFEETDLCYRLKAAGWETHFAPIATITHIGEASAVQQSADMTVQLVASNMLFCRRHYSSVRVAGLTTIMQGTMVMRIIRDTIRLYLAHDPTKSVRIKRDIVAWQRILRGHWRERLTYSSQDRNQSENLSSVIF